MAAVYLMVGTSKREVSHGRDLRFEIADDGKTDFSGTLVQSRH